MQAKFSLKLGLNRLISQRKEYLQMNWLKKRKKKGEDYDTSHIHIDHRGVVTVDVKKLLESEEVQDLLNSGKETKIELDRH